MTNALYRVKSKLFIRANRKAIHLLDGEYGSFTRGRSMDFDDLRVYVSGDEVKDIDWKATARYGSPLVKRYLASKRQNLVFIVDSGPNFSAVSEAGDTKSELAQLAVGMLAFLAVEHGDEVSQIHGAGDKPGIVPKGQHEGSIGWMLDAIQKHSTLASKQYGLVNLLEYAARTNKKRSIMVVVTDEHKLGADTLLAVRRLAAKHEVLWLTIADADPLDTANESFDIEDNILFPSYLSGDKQLAKSFQAAIAVTRAETATFLRNLGISHQLLTAEATVVRVLLAMLSRRMQTGV